MQSMKSLPEIIRFQQPLRQARLTGPPVNRRMEDRCQQREQSAYQRGRRDAEQAFSEQLLQQRAEVKTLQAGILTSLSQVLPTVTRQWEEGLIALTSELAGKVIAGLPVSHELVEAVVREALEQVEHQGSLVVLLHPEDLELLRKVNSPLLSEELGGEQISFRATSEVAHGGCLVETRFGLIDARREAKIEALKQSMGVTCN